MEQSLIQGWLILSLCLSVRCLLLLSGLTGSAPLALLNYAHVGKMINTIYSIG